MQQVDPPDASEIPTVPKEPRAWLFRFVVGLYGMATEARLGDAQVGQRLACREHKPGASQAQA